MAAVLGVWVVLTGRSVDDVLWDGWVVGRYLLGSMRGFGGLAVLTRRSGDDVSREALHRSDRHG